MHVEGLTGAERASVRTLPPRNCRPTRRANGAPDWRRRGRNRLARFIIHPPALPLVLALAALLTSPAAKPA
jgi:hypothetical protein